MAGRDSARDARRGRSSALLFFFFQAEDGIRDDLVTGVQTCALPIYAPTDFGLAPRLHRTQIPILKANPKSVGACDGKTNASILLPIAGRSIPIEPCRSEERRVGKECRSLLSPYH